MHQQDGTLHRQFYTNTIRTIHELLETPDDLCFVYVQHAFSPCIDHLACIGDRLAAVIPKGSSSHGNPTVVQQLQQLFPGKVLSNVNRRHLQDPAYAVQLLKHATRGRPFAILEYGAYFAPSAIAIATDPSLGQRLVGFVEGTENGIKGSGDGLMPGYRHVAAHVPCPILSKSKSAIKKIMDLEIGPAIVDSTDSLLRKRVGCRLRHWRGTVGVVGLGSIGQGVLRALGNYNINPLVYDTGLPMMAEMAYRQYNVANQTAILENSDILFLNTGNCFLSQQPDLLAHIKEGAILVLCTSGDVEAGLPQLIASGCLVKVDRESDDILAVYTTADGKRIRVLLGNDQIGQAPNMVIEDGSGSPANLMSDMEFYALGAYLSSKQNSLNGYSISESPVILQELIIREWMKVFYPDAVSKSASGAQSFVRFRENGSPMSPDANSSNSGFDYRRHQALCEEQLD